MSDRTWSSRALVLSLSTFGEGHRDAKLLTEDRGIVQAAVFGGAKSKLKGLVNPWHTGTVWIYSDPVKNHHKITDFDVSEWRQGIRESLARTFAASVCTEIVTRSHGVADWTIVNAFLDGIAVSSDDECRRALNRFLWRILHSAGIAPDLSCCSRCGRGMSGENGESTVSYYSPHEEAVLCADCARPEERSVPLSIEARSWLLAVERLPPSRSRAWKCEPREETEIRRFLRFLVSRHFGGELKTLNAAEGIL
ncbi:MAG: DNA repair protein RecO [Spirochaetales bacterium]|nr:DNA repair protein RecO [Spirochaetales bacterium]HPO01790.1 DNA repair protein RecO [Treponemataceae bacterium]